ncbi:MAG: enoyl-CoA hydratase-related protein [Deltaproteobacteria bacterium]
MRFETTSGGVAVITLSRPGHRNAFSGLMGSELGHAYQECDRNDDIRAVVLTGNGKDFCVGADLAGGTNTFEKQEETGFSAGAVEPPAFAIRKPVIAAVNGHAVGIGLTLPMQCDIRIFAREGKYGFLHVRRGVIPDAYAHFTVPRLAGFANATELMLTGRRITGPEAGSMGLANQVLPAAEVLPAALAIATDIATNVAPLSAAFCKKLLWESPNDDHEAIGRKETVLHHLVMGQPDAAEGVMAFLEKREPKWKLKVSENWPDRWPK